MDVISNGYTTPMRMGVGQTPLPVRWFHPPPLTPIGPDWHAFGNITWDGNWQLMLDTGGLGEVPQNPRPWVSRKPGAAWGYKHVAGPVSYFYTGSGLVFAALRRQPSGVPFDCNMTAPADAAWPGDSSAAWVAGNYFRMPGDSAAIFHEGEYARWAGDSTASFAGCRGLSMAWGVAGTYSWTAPPNVTSVSVKIYGAGASGTIGWPPVPAYPGIGGGGGAYAANPAVPVTPGTAYAVVVGAGGGLPPVEMPGLDGGPTYFDTLSTVFADPGKGGLGLTGAGGAGGSAGASVGTVTFSGGSGGPGPGAGSGTTGGSGGGSSAAASGAGNTGGACIPAGGAGGAPLPGGGAGGQGGFAFYPSVSGGVAGTPPGGGGGGGGVLVGLAGAGAGFGADGQITLLWCDGYAGIAAWPGDSTAAFVGASTATSALSAPGDSSAAWVGTAAIPASLSAPGDSSAAWVGASLVAVSLSAPGNSSAAFVSGARFSEPGDSTAAFVGTTAPTNAFSMPGTSTATFNGPPTAGQNSGTCVTNGTSFTATWASAIAAGDWLVVTFFEPVGAITPTAPATWVLAKSNITVGGPAVWLYVLPNAPARAAGATDTWTWTGTTNMSGCWFVIKGAAGTGTVDKTGIANGATSTLSVATSGSTTQASEIAIAAWGAFLGNDATLTFSGPGSGFVIASQHSCDNTGLATTYASCLTWKILTTTGVAGTQLTVSTSATMEKAAIATLDA